MTNYQVLARKYRPQRFSDVIGQEAIVTTLKNAIKNQRLAHAYLFCGSRGTGKTTLARVFAKALNCESPQDGEPCNHCQSCKEIALGNSLDVLEIDGASHRGIDDIRQINETVGYATSSGKYKIYLIDEVHMLTKEAFNALLKTLEEPPAKVLFLFATTEPHKVLPTILSRCQRFNLNRIPLNKITDKLRLIATDQKVEVEDAALRLLAERADGGLRDAESLFDQIIAFHEGTITVQTVADVLGVMNRDVMFALDQAGKEGRLSMAFDIAHQIYSQGKDLMHFIDSLTAHFRTLLLIKLAGMQTASQSIQECDKSAYEASAQLYSQEQCLTILDMLIEAQNQIRFQSSIRTALEALLLRIMRIHQRLPIEYLVRRLNELEQAVLASPAKPTTAAAASSSEQKPQTAISPTPPSATAVTTPVIPKEPVVPAKSEKVQIEKVQSVSIDPTPSPEDLGKKQVSKQTVVEKVSSKVPETLHSIPAEPASVQPLVAAPISDKQPSMPPPPTNMSNQRRYDTLMQFAAIELEGTIQRNK